MNCAEVQERLSAYHDAELLPEERAKVTQHLAECPDCSKEQAKFESLSGMLPDFDAPLPPRLAWERFEQRLDDNQINEEESSTPNLMISTRWQRFRGTVLRPGLVVAALVLVAVGWFAFEAWFGANNQSLLAADFSRYVEEFEQNPSLAQKKLLKKYDGRKIDLTKAVQQIGYQPAVADGLPAGYTLDSVYMLKMPCCDCLQTICERSDGSKIAIFEYGDEQPVSFGNRQERSAKCHGKNCRLVEVNEQLAGSWKQDGRRISVVGARDQTEIESLVASLD